METLTLPRGHLATGRLVWTYLPKGQPAGLLTGYEDDRGGVVLEHLVAWQGIPLPRLLEAGLEEAWTRGFQHVIVMIPLVHAKATRLEVLALRMGFTEYARDQEAAWFVRYKP